MDQEKGMALLDELRKMLGSFGYKTTEEDDIVLALLLSHREQSIKNECNIDMVPTGLDHILINQVCGRFLLARYTSGQLELPSLDLGGALSSISEGDVSVSFDSDASDDAKMQMLIRALCDTGKDELLCYRKLRW